MAETKSAFQLYKMTTEYLQKSDPSDPNWEKMQATQAFAEGFLEDPDKVMTLLSEKIVVLLQEKKQ